MVKKLILADRAACTARAISEDGTETVLSVEGLTPEPKVIRLAEVKRTGDGRFDFTSLPAGGDVLVAGEVIRAMNVQSELDAAVKDGKITPAQRPHYEKLALSDLAGFRELVKSMKPQVDLSERGIAGGADEGGGLKKVDQLIDQKVRERLGADTDLSYHQALRAVLSENPDLRQAKNLAMRD